MLSIIQMPNPEKPELNIEDLWYRFALSFLFKMIGSHNFSPPPVD
jgi:hypothetical protein